MSNIETPIICALVADVDRANFLPKFLGFDTLIFELTTIQRGVLYVSWSKG